MKSLIEKNFRESISTKEKVLSESIETIEAIAKLWIHSYRNKAKILFCGNGGSAADCQHIATELMVRLKHDSNRAALPAIALTTDTSLLTAGANDYGFDYIFSRQVEGLGNAGDILVAISTSGNSQNVIEAVNVAKEKGLKVVGLLGNTGGKLADLCDEKIIVPHHDSGRIQETHILLGHILCELTEKELYG